MANDKNHYFIELQMDERAGVPRNREAEVRRAQAAEFIDHIHSWLHEQAMDDRVASMAITALGQVQITCDQDIISKLRGDENLHIAAVRQSVSLADGIRVVTR